VRGPAHWIWRALTVLLAPWAALVMAVHPRTRETWSQRWGWRLAQVPPGGVVIHAASVGEGQIAATLFEALRECLPGVPLIRSAWTNTGLQTAQGHHAALPLPVDLWGIVGPWLDQVRPGVLVLVETELWPNLLASCAERHIPVLVIGTRNSDGLQGLETTYMMSLIRSCVTTWLPAEDLPWAAGIGSLKGASKTPLTLELARPILIGASTREGDETALLAAWEALGRPGSLILAPRHPERFEAVSRLLPVGTPCRSQGQTGPMLLWDTLGELDSLMPLADVVFIGGTFDKDIGGHAPHAALQAGAAVIHGPYTASNSEGFDPNRCIQALTIESLKISLSQAIVLGRIAPSESPPAALEPTLRAIQDSLTSPAPPGPKRPWLRPLDRLWAAIARARIKPGQSPPIPCICVGGLSAGGSGKTPVVQLLVAKLQARGLKCAVVSRGYGRSGHSQGLRETGDLGDELNMLRAQGTLCVSSPDRMLGVRRAQELGAQVVVLDDAFQNHQVAAMARVLVLNADDPLDGGVIPVGMAREDLSAVERADLVVWTGGEGKLQTECPQAVAHLEPTHWRLGSERFSLSEGPQGPVQAVAGIAHPERFLQSLLDLGLDVRAWHPLADHAALPRLGPGTWVCTEKDWARSKIPQAWALCVRLRIDNSTLDSLLDRVLEAT
jgi:tetraacyldisaccharide 4'-kinase